MARNCCICRSNGQTVEVDGHEPFAVLSCRECELIFLASHADQSGFVDDAYAQRNGEREKTVEYWSFPDLYRKHKSVFDGYFVERLKRLRSAVLELRSVLDIGCGYGFFAKYLQQVGIDFEGMDIHQPCVDYARDQLGLGVDCCDFLDYRTDGRFDGIVACDVLEHVEDPTQFLARCRQLMNPGGIIYLQVPNVVEGKIPADGSFNWPYHLWQFSPKTLRTLLEKNGFDIVDWWTGVMGVIGVYERGGPTDEDFAAWDHAAKNRCGNRLQMLARVRDGGKG